MLDSTTWISPMGRYISNGTEMIHYCDGNDYKLYDGFGGRFCGINLEDGIPMYIGSRRPIKNKESWAGIFGLPFYLLLFL